MIFNEDSRVKIPAIVHLTRLGYTYLPLKNANWEKSTNVFLDIFKKKVAQLNTKLTPNEVERCFEEISLSLEKKDLGRAFFEKLIDRSGIRLIDFEDFSRNDFNVFTELTYQKDDEEFSPDLTILINGMPPPPTEVKKQIQEISSLRDWLLPMLMNGQVRVSDENVERVRNLLYIQQ